LEKQPWLRKEAGFSWLQLPARRLPRR